MIVNTQGPPRVANVKTGRFESHAYLGLVRPPRASVAVRHPDLPVHTGVLGLLLIPRRILALALVLPPAPAPTHALVHALVLALNHLIVQMVILDNNVHLLLANIIVAPVLGQSRIAALDAIELRGSCTTGRLV